MKNFLKEVIILILVNAVLLFLIHDYVPDLGFQITETRYSYVVTFFVLGAIFWFLNMVLKRIIKVITIPIKYLTLGLSSILINIGIFYLFEILLKSYDVGILIQVGNIVQVFIMSLLVTGVYFLAKKLI